MAPYVKTQFLSIFYFALLSVFTENECHLILVLFLVQQTVTRNSDTGADLGLVTLVGPGHGNITLRVQATLYLAQVNFNTASVYGPKLDHFKKV